MCFITLKTSVAMTQQKTFEKGKVVNAYTEGACDDARYISDGFSVSVMTMTTMTTNCVSVVSVRSFPLALVALK